MEQNYDWTETIAERKIQEAMEAGEFENLPGRGQPLDLDYDPSVPVHLRVVNRILKNARALPEWIQLEKDIERETGLLTTTRERTLRALRYAKNDASRVRIVERQRADHRERISLVNTLILKYNMIAPQMARRAFSPVNLKHEMEALEDAMGRARP